MVNRISRQTTPQLVLLGGPSGVGKTAVVEALLARHQSVYSRPRSFTSRQRRPGETDWEFEFVSGELIRQLHRQGKVPSVDCPYGSDLYAMSSESIDSIRSENRIPVKEVHPKNHEKIRISYPKLVSVLLVPETSVISKQRARDSTREAADDEYFGNLDERSSDLIIRVDAQASAEVVAEHLNTVLVAMLNNEHLFPRPKIIDDLNLIGYERVSKEFTEDKRVTTRNFHELTEDFFRSLPSTVANQPEFDRLGDKLLEVGVGSGWLQYAASDLPITASVDLSPAMVSQARLRTVAVQSARHLPFSDYEFDGVVSSLADPFCYPSALCEIRRVIRPRGFLAFSSPCYEWSSAIRTSIPWNITHFLRKDSQSCDVFSFTFTADELYSLLELCGFKVVSVDTIRGDELCSREISPALTEAAAALGVRLDRMPIINTVVATPNRGSP